ncbi:MAG: ABC transporter permease subunit [Galbitalea sp.]
MVRSAADAFAAVPDGVRESARAVGFSVRQSFFGVELPLSGPILLAGVRVVSVSTVSLVTVGSFIGIPSLGNLFHDGQQINYPPEIWIGIGIVLLIALVYDIVISSVGRLLMPWNRRASRRRAARILLTEAAA